MPLKPGDVLRIWDRWTKPPKFKRHICVCVSDRLFLRINTKPVFKPNYLIRADECDFLVHDSYVELTQLVRHFESDIEGAEFLGSISQALRTRLKLVVAGSKTLTQDQKDLIERAL